MNKSKKFRIENLILLTLVVVSIVVLCISAKITFLSIDMFILRDNANFYNESVVKTDESADYYNDNDAKRQEIYNSDDALVRGFSNSNTAVKLIGAIVATILFVGIPSAWIYCIVKVMKATGTRRHHQNMATRSRWARM